MEIKTILTAIEKEITRDEAELVIKAMVTAWNRVNPKWELLCISLPMKDSAEREMIMKTAVDMVRREQEERSQLTK